MEARVGSSPRLCAAFTLNTDEIGWSLSEWGTAVKRGVFVNEKNKHQTYYNVITV